MTGKEFFEQNKGGYFYYEGEKVRVVGYDGTTQQIIVSKKEGWHLESFQSESIEYIDQTLVYTGDTFWFVDEEELTPIEQPELDICELLEGCEGMILYSTMVGYCRLIELTEFITIGYGDNDYVVLESDGKYSVEGECTLFPSKENRDWSTFKKPVNKKVLKDGDYVLCGDDVFQTELRQYFKDNKCYASGINNRRSILKDDWKYIIPFEDYDPSLSEEELKKLSIV